MGIQFYINSLPHLLPYALLLLAYLFLSFRAEISKDRWFGVPTLIILCLFAGFRDAIMTPDMERYRWLYVSAGEGQRVALEPSFVYLSRFFHALGFDYHALFFTYTLVTLTFIYLGIKNYSPYIKLSLLLYILIPASFLNMFVEMRQVCAVAIAFYATSLLVKDEVKYRLFRFIIFAILAVLFHYSALLYWPLFFLVYKFVKREHSTSLYLALLAISFLIPPSAFVTAARIIAEPMAPARYRGYIDAFIELQKHQAESGQLIKSVVYTLMAACFIFSRRAIRDDEKEQMPLNLFIIGVVILNLTRSFAAISRIAFYFITFQIIIFPFIAMRVKDRARAILATYSLVLLYLLQFVYGLFYYAIETDSYVFLHFQNAIFSIFK